MPDKLDDELRITLMRIARRIRQQRHDDTLSDSQLSVLYVLTHHGGSTLAALAEHEHVTPPSMNRTVNCLSDEGLITRSSSPDDGRKVLIEATDAGIELVDKTRQRRAAWFAAELEGLSPEEHAALHAAIPVLVKLANS
ncbi:MULTISPECIES: MarR family winged helix-turn-helix transcriptional regulator [unclassified Salinibacterium]|uniref:MarR family winged helix-turn-helix transcriptional regulator n=1 Tax=unclassified Salinibacterium TaxID=2632331 RepID=UPI0018CFA1C5|nr:MULTISPECIES: MarR family transcriptional regulator [unclassified Salinibacterium]MBH0052602.1 MarR family transcriptional regulator [Salinibacterium sp. SWN139]MBH0081860.1 MarR family transcriptional regulator [Salinibacterium sp. SWN167]